VFWGIALIMLCIPQRCRIANRKACHAVVAPGHAAIVPVASIRITISLPALLLV
jgi:hypothetical protein